MILANDGYLAAPTRRIAATNTVEYAYRETGNPDGPPLVLLQHFRGSLDSWDPALIDALTPGRRVITFDNRGVAGSSGTTPATISEMARDALAFIDALGLEQVDLLGFSIGSFVAPEIALIRPAAVRRTVLAASAPQGASAMHGWAPAVIEAVGGPQTSAEQYLSVFFTATESGAAAGRETARRIFGERTENHDQPTDWATRLAQYDAVCAWGIPEHAKLQRVAVIEAPVFITAGDSDPMILPHYSYLLAGLIPAAQLKIYPDAAHGFLFQHHRVFAADIDAFLTR